MPIISKRMHHPLQLFVGHSQGSVSSLAAIDKKKQRHSGECQRLHNSSFCSESLNGKSLGSVFHTSSLPHHTHIYMLSSFRLEILHVFCVYQAKVVHRRMTTYLAYESRVFTNASDAGCYKSLRMPIWRGKKINKIKKL